MIEDKLTDADYIAAGMNPPVREEQEPELPVRKDWRINYCDDRYLRSGDDDFRRQALECLYIAISPGGGAVYNDKTLKEIKRHLAMLDEIAVFLVGGIPAESEKYT